MKAMKILLGALVALMVLGGMAMAQTGITTTVSASKEIQLPTGDINIASLVVGDNGPIDLPGIIVHTNEATYFTAIASGAYANQGKFYGTNGWFQNKFTLSCDSPTGITGYGPSPVDTIQNLAYISAAGDYNMPLKLNQNVAGVDGTGSVKTEVTFAI
jgi:hypothetical protein